MAKVEVREKFQKARDEMSRALVERDAEVDAVLTALLANEAVLLVGNPGTAKSMLADSVLDWMSGAKKFSILMTKFSTPEELVGPVSISGLKNDKYYRVTDGKLPEAEVVFLDEIWKSSSAILNTLLKILNEKRYDRGDGVERPVPLKLCVAASNEWPQAQEGGKELAALFDRFVIRKRVAPVATARGRERLLWEDDHRPKFTARVTVPEVEAAQAAAAALPWSKEARDAYEAILAELSKEGVQPGDRRKVKAKGVVRAFAYLDGADEVLPEHLEVLQHVLWDDPQEQPDKVAQVVAKTANPTSMLLTQYLMEAEQLIAGVDYTQLTATSAACTKLAATVKKLKQMPKGSKVQQAIDYLEGQVKAIKIKTFESQGLG